MGVDLFTKPDLITKAKEEFVKRIGDVVYKPLTGDRKPPLEYRKGLVKQELRP